MTSEANLRMGREHTRLMLAAGDRDRSRAFAAAGRHSRIVRLLKFSLPAIAAAAVGLYFVSYLLSSRLSVSLGKFEASIGGVEISREALRMLNPKIEGVAGKGGHYVVRADYADQSVEQPSLIRLTKVSAEMIQADRRSSTMSAPSGNYDSKLEGLSLDGEIVVKSDNGMTAYLASAAIDLKQETVHSVEPVRVEMINGTLRSGAMQIDMRKNQIQFDGDVKVHLQRPGERSSPQPAAQAAAKPNTKPDTKPGLSALSFKRDRPIDIAAPKLTIRDGDKQAHFVGGVTAVQGTSRLTSRRLTVHYTKSAAAADAGGAQSAAPDKDAAQNTTDIKAIEAIEDVLLVTDDGRRAAARHLTYDAEQQVVVMEGDVTLSHGGDVIKGQRFVSELDSGKSRFDPGGRVLSHFAARGADGPGAPPSNISVGASQLDLSSARGKPIDVESNEMEVDDRTSVALFKGDVNVAQGGMTMRSRELHVDYAADGAQAAAQPGTQIRKIMARGKVLINTPQDQTATSDWALFDVKSQTVTIGGNVVLSQTGNVVKGDRLVIDMKTGLSRFENEGDLATRQRVRGLFKPKTSEQRDKEQGGVNGAPAGGGRAAAR